MARKLQHPVPDELLRHIGDMTVSFALLEAEIQAVVQHLLSTGQRMGQVITSELSFRNLRALTVSAAKERFGDGAHLEEVRELLRRATALEVSRNQITHSLWGAGSTPSTITRIKTTAKEKHGLKFVFEEVSTERLQTLCLDIKVLASDVQQFWMKQFRGGSTLG